jgi:hypothetical protein
MKASIHMAMLFTSSTWPALTEVVAGDRNCQGGRGLISRTMTGRAG